MPKLTDEAKLKCSQLRELLSDSITLLADRPAEDINWHRVDENMTFGKLLIDGIMLEVDWSKR